MLNKNKMMMGFAASLLVASTSFAMAQATGTENNATTGSEPGTGPASGMEKKGVAGSMSSGSAGAMKSSGSMGRTAGKPPVEGAAGAPTPQTGDHHEPTTGAGK